MKKIIKVSLSVLGSIFVLFIALVIWAVNSDGKSTSQTEQVANYIEIEGDDLNNFLNLKFVENNPWQVDSQNRLIGKTVQDVVYSGSESEGYKIGIPKRSIEAMISGGYHYSIDIFKINNSQEQLLARLVLRDYPDKKDEIGVYSVIVEGDSVGGNLYLDDALEYASNVFPNSFFDDALAFRTEANRQNDLRNQTKQEEEYAAKFTHEGWPRNSVYTSVLLLREGILDFHEKTVGEVFYTGKRFEGITVSEPRKGGRFQIISITSSLNSSAKFDIFLRYDDKSQMSLIDKIDVKDGNKSSSLTTFEEKYAGLMMILPLIMNEGNLGE
jgi:archaellum component FlaG (FlaF/FlaG flagellin family)